MKRFTRCNFVILELWKVPVKASVQKTKSRHSVDPSQHLIKCTHCILLKFSLVPDVSSAALVFDKVFSHGFKWIDTVVSWGICTNYLKSIYQCDDDHNLQNYRTSMKNKVVDFNTGQYIMIDHLTLCYVLHFERIWMVFKFHN